MKPRISWDADAGKWRLAYGRTVMDQRVSWFRFWPLAVGAALAPDAQAARTEACS